jgi:hypothetical protein
MEKQPITTIKIHKETKERLDKLKENKRETYEEVLKKILFILNTSKTNPQRARSLMRRIDGSQKNVKQYTEVYEKDEKEN